MDNELKFYSYKIALDYLKKTNQIGNSIYDKLIKKYAIKFKPTMWEFY